MPTIALFYGIAIRMYVNDHNPPHFHAIYGRAQAIISIENGSVIGGALPPTARRIVLAWAKLRKAELLENWRNGRAKIPFARIPGPDGQG